MIGRMMAMEIDKGTSWRSAMMMPPIAIIGAKSISAEEPHERLHLLDVVGIAGDQRRGAEAADLALGEALDLSIEVPPHIASEPHRGPRHIERGSDRARDDDAAQRRA